MYWLLLAGRGSGKTRSGSEWIRAVKEHVSPIALVGPTAADVRDVMVRGPAGLLAIAPPDDYPDYQPSNRRVVWRNGAYALLFSAEEPDRLRGPNHAAAWCDELACLIAGTLIETPLGPKPIETIRQGDFVETRSGPRRVAWAGLTRQSAPLWKLTTTAGDILIGTANHPVFIDKKGFVQLQSLVVGDGLVKWRLSKASSGAVGDGGSITAITDTCYVANVQKLDMLLPVYNLEVIGEHEYFANGIVVHNSWQYPEETWSNLQFGLRSGPQPRACITTTPRPIKLIRQLMEDPLSRVSRTSSYHNRAHLAPSFFDQIIKRYEGTRLGRQEIYGELLEDVPGALWTHDIIERTRLPYYAKLPDFARIVVAIDPAMTSGEDADSTGIVVAAKDSHEHAYVLADHSGHYQPHEWAQTAIAAFHNPARPADRIVAEVNNGGEMVEHTIRMIDPGVPFTAVHASRGKVIRAEPVSALYQQERVHHIGTFGALEDEMTSFTIDWDRATNGSPDRVDALVWAITELIIAESAPDYWLAWSRW